VRTITLPGTTTFVGRRAWRDARVSYSLTSRHKSQAIWRDCAEPTFGIVGHGRFPLLDLLSSSAHAGEGGQDQKSQAKVSNFSMGIALPLKFVAEI
jgi:hypothetical protein